MFPVHSMTPEGKVKHAVKKFLVENGVWYFMPVSNGMGQVGIPDFVCCHRGYFYAVECKAPGKRGNTTPNQERVIAMLRDHGGRCLVVDDATQLTDFFT